MDGAGFGDWGLYAAVELDDPDVFDWGEELGEAKVGELPTWMLDFAGERRSNAESKDSATIPGVMYGPAAAAKSPLLNGRLIKTPQKRLLLILWTT
ncbi:hypothetical protein [Blastopirellula retiformator]|nr:hypothetical protein [Blastopirellula retiformator]